VVDVQSGGAIIKQVAGAFADILNRDDKEAWGGLRTTRVSSTGMVVDESLIG